MSENKVDSETNSEEKGQVQNSQPKENKINEILSAIKAWFNRLIVNAKTDKISAAVMGSVVFVSFLVVFTLGIIIGSSRTGTAKSTSKKQKASKKTKTEVTVTTPETTDAETASEMIASASGSKRMFDIITGEEVIMTEPEQPQGKKKNTQTTESVENSYEPNPLSDFTWHVNDDGTGLWVKYIGLSTTINFPKTIYDIPVKEVKVEYVKGRAGPLSIVIPEGITELWSVPEGSIIADIKIPLSLAKIDDNAFKSCKFTNLVLPEFCQIGAGAFMGTDFPKLVIRWNTGKDAFSYNTTLKEVSFTDSASIIGDCAFRNCQALTKVTLPENITSMGVFAFNCDQNLVTVEGLKNVLSWESNTFGKTGQFDDCEALSLQTQLLLRKAGYKGGFLWLKN